MNSLILDSFIEEFWFVPSDAFLRALEAEIWSAQELEPPVLDIGCGDGKISRLLFAKYRIDVGIDLNPQAIREARRSGVYKRVVVADAQNLPFKKEGFKTVISNSTLEHIKDDIKAISEVTRVLKTGGRLLFTVPSPRFARALRTLGLTREQLRRYNQRVAHLHYRSSLSWVRILERFNLRILKFNYYFPVEATGVWLRLFRLATLKIYHREFWSYLKDSPWGGLFPKKLVVPLLKIYLRKYFKPGFTRNGMWMFIIAQKQE